MAGGGAEVGGDLNGEGQPDLLGQHPTTGAVYVWFMDGTTQTGGVSLGTVPDPWQLVELGGFGS